MYEDRVNRLQAFVDWVGRHISGDEKGEAQVFLDHLFKAFARPGVLEASGKLEMRVKKAGGASFADYVWKPIVLIEIKKRGADLAKHLQQAFDYWIRLAPGRPKYTVLCNFDEFWIYDFNEDINEPLDKLILPELPKRFGPSRCSFSPMNNPPFASTAPRPRSSCRRTKPAARAFSFWPKRPTATSASSTSPAPRPTPSDSAITSSPASPPKPTTTSDRSVIPPRAH